MELFLLTMGYTVVLGAHIAVGMLTLLAASAVCVVAYTAQRVSARWRHVTTVVLYAGAAGTLYSGSLVAVLSPTITGWSLCGNVVAYLCVVGLALFVARGQTPVAALHATRAFSGSIGVFIGITVFGL